MVSLSTHHVVLLRFHYRLFDQVSSKALWLAGSMAPGANCPLVVRFCPKALGQHRASLSVQVLSEHSNKAIAEVPFKVLGICRQLGGPKGPLPGGPSALPETFAKPRQFVDQEKVNTPSSSP